MGDSGEAPETAFFHHHQQDTKLWASRARPAVTEPGLKPESLVAQLALRCSPLDHCATREAKS